MELKEKQLLLWKSELGKKVDIEEVKQKILKHFKALFEVDEFISFSKQEILQFFRITMRHKLFFFVKIHFIILHFFLFIITSF